MWQNTTTIMIRNKIAKPLLSFFLHAHQVVELKNIKKYKPPGTEGLNIAGTHNDVKERYLPEKKNSS